LRINTIRNVTMADVVFMTSCHVSEKRKTGPASAQARMTAIAITVAKGLPDAALTDLAIDENRSRTATRELGR
jgi:hypothetical protein